MSDILFHYERVNPTTWAYLSSLLTIALFFKFNRFFSVRNLDLVLLVLLAPGLLCVKYALDHGGEQVSGIAQFGYIWLFSVSGLLLVRMLIDSAMVRRPLLEPNLSAGGLGFLTGSLLLFLLANVLNGSALPGDLSAVQRADNLRHGVASELESDALTTHGPGFPFLFLLPHISTQQLLGPQGDEPPTNESGETASVNQRMTAKMMATLCQLLIVLGMVLVAKRHFDNARLGIAAATLYLMLPYTAMWTGSVTHALPGALLVWAVLFYRRPIAAGALLGLGCATIYYPYALLPLWISFYWRRGLWRFLGGFVVMLAVVVVTLVFTSADTATFVAHLRQMFGLHWPQLAGLSGVWQYWEEWSRIPVIAAFVGLAISFAFWPAQKNLATLLSGTAALMLGVQFWHAHSDGIALAWYLPVLLLTVFRPNLENRMALDVVSPTRLDRPTTAKAS